jgi:transcriptional regulator with XRE-family HTH domain
MSLDKRLKSLRKSLGLTLRNVEQKTDISNAYLSQLENGKAKSPSPAVLLKLSNLYEIDQIELLQLAGYINEKEPYSSDISNKAILSFNKLTKNQKTAIEKLIIEIAKPAEIKD